MQMKNSTMRPAAYLKDLAPAYNVNFEVCAEITVHVMLPTNFGRQQATRCASALCQLRLSGTQLRSSPLSIARSGAVTKT